VNLIASSPKNDDLPRMFVHVAVLLRAGYRHETQHDACLVLLSAPSRPLPDELMAFWFGRWLRRAEARISCSIVRIARWRLGLSPPQKWFIRTVKQSRTESDFPRQVTIAIRSARRKIQASVADGFALRSARDISTRLAMLRDRMCRAAPICTVGFSTRRMDCPARV